MEQQTSANQEIQQHREAIDALDEQIVVLLNKRQSHALAIRAVKQKQGVAIFDPARETEIIERLQGLSEGPLQGEYLAEIYGTIMKVSKEV